MKITELADLVEVIANDTDDLKVRDSDEKNFEKNFQSGRNNLSGQIFASGNSEFVFNQEISLTMSVNIINNFQKVKTVPYSDQIYAAILYGMDTQTGKKPNFFSDAYASAIFRHDIYNLKNAGDVIMFDMGTIGSTNDNPEDLISKMQAEITVMGGNDFKNKVTIINNSEQPSSKNITDTSSQHAYTVTIPSKMYYQYIAAKIQTYVDNTDVRTIKETITNNIHTAASNVASNDFTVIAYDSSDIQFNASQIAKSDVELIIGDDQSAKHSSTIDVNEENEENSTSDVLSNIESKGEIDQNSVSDHVSTNKQTANQSSVVIMKESEKSRTLKNILIILVTMFLLCLFFGCVYTIRNRNTNLQSTPIKPQS